MTILLAVSGGRDSITMADMCFRHISFSADKEGVFKDAGFAVAHCNFHLRGEESDADELFVRNWAQERSIRFHSTGFDTARFAEAHSMSLEMAARELRYTWFSELCMEYGYDAVAVAHNANDNAETLILNLLRGSGLNGVCGMSFVSRMPYSPDDRPVRLFRPLIDVPRSAIDEYVRENSLPFCTDRTNLDCKYRRNLIRNKVFPLFSRINPSYLSTLNEDMGNFSRARDILDKWRDSNTEKVSVENDSSEISLSVQKLKDVDNWEYLLYSILSRYGFNRDVCASIESALKQEGGTFSGKVFISPTHKALTSRDRIDVLRADCDDSTAVELRIEREGEYAFNGISFSVLVRPNVPGTDLKCAPGELVCDASELAFPFICRGWRCGDWFVPFGMKGRKKLSDFFSDRHFTLEDKRRALVIQRENQADSRVAAILGQRIDDSLRVTGDTRQLLYFIVNP